MKSDGFVRPKLLIQNAVAAILLGALAFCAEYTNPVDPAYKGDYDFDIAKSERFSAVEIFTSITAVIENKGKDLFLRFSVILPDPTIATYSFSSDQDTVTFYFKKSYNGVFQIEGLQPNGKTITKSVNINIVNPYSIVNAYFPSGRTRAGIGDSAHFIIKRNDKLPFDNVFEKIEWQYNGINTVLSSNEHFVISSDSALTAEISAQLIDSLSNTYTIQDTVIFSGFAPVINTISILNLDKQQINSVPPWDSFYVAITLSDRDSNMLSLSILQGDTILYSDSAVLPNTTRMCLMPAMHDTLLRTYRIVLIDSTGLGIVETLFLSPAWTPATVNFPDTIKVSSNHESVIPITSYNNAVTLIWLISKNDTTVQTDTIILPDQFKLKALEDTKHTYLATVTPYDKSNFKGVPDSIVIIPIHFSHVLSASNGQEIFRADTIKYNSTYTFSLTTKYNDTLVSGIGYKWSCTPDFDTLKKFLRSDNIFNSDSSLITLSFKDSVPSNIVSISVHGEVAGGDSLKTQTITRNLLTRWYKPRIRSVKHKDSSDVNIPVQFSPDAYDTDSSKVTLFYALVPDSTVWIPYDTVNGIVFYSAGTKTVLFKAVDQDSLQSSVVTTSLRVFSTKPSLSVDKKFIGVRNDSISLDGITPHPGKGNFIIDSLFWDLDNDGTFETITKPDSSPKFFCKSVGTFTIRVFCKDIRPVASVSSDTVSVLITVLSDVPVLESIKISPDTQYINKPVTLSLFSTDHDDSLLIAVLDTNGVPFYRDTIPDSLHLITIRFSKPGTFNINVHLEDFEGHTSNSITRKCVIDPGKPRITALDYNKTSAYYVNDSISFVISSTDNDTNSIRARYYHFGDVSKVKISLKDTIKASFPDSGMKKLYVQIEDKDSVKSNWESVTFPIRLGKPTVSIVSKPGSVFIHNQAEFVFSLYDTNGVLKRYDVSWTGSTNDYTSVSIDKQRGETVLISRIFEKADTGLKELYFRVLDEDSVPSEWRSYTVLVDKGTPRITAITLDTLVSNLFVNDNRTFTIRTTDPNGNGDSVFVAWNGSTLFSHKQKIAGDSCTFNRTFTTSDAGSKSIRFRVVDKDGFIHDSTRTFVVRLGAPVVSKSILDSVWVNDINLITVQSHDTNGYVVKRWVDWDTTDNIEWNDSSTTSNTFSYKWDSSFGGTFIPCRVKVMDDDGLTTTKICSVLVKMGRPVVKAGRTYGNASAQWSLGKNAIFDTLFYVRSEGQPTYSCVDTLDTNGTCLQYFWDWQNPDLIDDTTVVPYKTRDGLRLNDTNRVTVTCKDDDSIRSLPYTFYIFPDAPPVAPMVSHGIVGDSIDIYWSGRDLKDGTSTQYKILIRDGAAPTESDSLTKFTPGISNLFRDATADGYQLKYRFKVAANLPKHVYQYRIIARDARGSTVSSNIQTFSY